MKTKLLILFLVLFVPNGKVFLQEIPDSCYKVITHGSKPLSSFNPDSIAIDTCLSTSTNVVWAAKYFYSKFNSYIFNTFLPMDSIADISIIDSINFPTIYSRFKDIKNNLGDYYFFRDSVDNDSIFLLENRIVLRFNQYQNADTIMSHFFNIDSLNFILFWHPIDVTEINESSKKEFDFFNLYLNDNELTIILGSEYNQGNINIYNLYGQLVKSYIVQDFESTNINIDLSHFSKGIYICQYNNYYKLFLR